LQLTPSVTFGRVKHAGVMAVLVCAATLSVGGGGGAVAASGAAKPSPAGALAQHVLDGAIVPPGARVTTVVRSRTLKGNPDEKGIPGSHDAHRFYLVDELMDALESCLAAHVPQDATRVGNGSEDDSSGVWSVSLSYDLPVSGPHNYLAELSYLSVATGSGTELRVDAGLVWKPNRPADERAPRNGVVEVTACPEAALMAGSSGPVTFTVTGARARSLLRALNALPLGPRAFCLENALSFKLAICAYGSSPPGGSVPRGTLLGVVVDATTFRVTDWGLSTRPSPVRLSSLGRVHTLHLASAAPVRDAGKGAKLTSRLELSRTTEEAGASIGAVLVVTNPGTRINETHGCAPYLMVVLANKEIPADGVIPTPCRPGPYWIRHGVNRLRIVVSTRYAVCTQTPAQATVRLPVCQSGPVEAPPLPAGRYRTVAIGAWGGIPMPAPVAVTLTR
jgi:hypothetical protein